MSTQDPYAEFKDPKEIGDPYAAFKDPAPPPAYTMKMEATGAMPPPPMQTPPPPERVPASATNMFANQRAMAPELGEITLERARPLETFKTNEDMRKQHAQQVENALEYDKKFNEMLEKDFGIKDPSIRAAIIAKAPTLLQKQTDRELSADDALAQGFRVDSENQPIIQGSGEMYLAPINRLNETMGLYKRSPKPNEMQQGWTMINGVLQGGIFNKRTGQPMSLYNAIPPSTLPRITEGEVYLYNPSTGQFEKGVKATQRQVGIPIAGQDTFSGPVGKLPPGQAAPTAPAAAPPIQGQPVITEEAIQSIMGGNKRIKTRDEAIDTLKKAGYTESGVAMGTTGPQGATPPPATPPTTTRTPGVRPGESLGPLAPATQANQYRQALTPTREIGTTFFTDPVTPWRETMEDFADIADHEDRAKAVGGVANLIINGLQKGGEHGESAAVNFGGVGLSTGAVGNWLGNLVGLPGLQSQGQVNTVYDAYKGLDEREQRAVKTVIAAYGVIPGLRAATKNSALRFAVEKLENEIATFGNTTSRQQYYTNLYTIAKELNNIYKGLGMETTDEGHHYVTKEKYYSYLSRVKKGETFRSDKTTGDVQVLKNGKWVAP